MKLQKLTVVINWAGVLAVVIAVISLIASSLSQAPFSVPAWVGWLLLLIVGILNIILAAIQKSELFLRGLYK